MSSLGGAKIQLFARRYEHTIGIARYIHGLQQGLRRMGVAYDCVEPAYPLVVRAGAGLLKPLGYDLKTFFTNYPVAARLRRGSVIHLTAQMQACLLSFKPGLRRVVVTVHDIVPYLVRDDPQQSTFRHPLDRYFDQLAMHNLRKADLLIAVSAHTKAMIVRHLACKPEKILVILEGVEHEHFHRLDVGDGYLARYGVQPGQPSLLYVGSENPRKNLPFLLRALAQARQRLPGVRLLKVGAPENLPQRQALKQLIAELELEDVVIFLEQVSQAELTLLYNAVDAFVFPSLYEGFGFPPLEAMACGTPVVCSTAASLPEVVGEAALSVEPTDLQGWVSALERILQDDPLRSELQQRGLERARQFTWERAAQQTYTLYQELM